MNLAEKMECWSRLRQQADALEEEIKAEILLLGKTQDVGIVRASYSDGRGRYDYESMVKSCPFVSPQAVERHTSVKVDWRSIAEELDLSDKFKQQFYTPGSPTVSLKIRE